MILCCYTHEIRELLMTIRSVIEEIFSWPCALPAHYLGEIYQNGDGKEIDVRDL